MFLHVYYYQYIANTNKKAELWQRWPRNAPYIWVLWKFLGVPDCAHGYLSRNY